MAPARTLLVTGFGSFPGMTENPSAALIDRLRAAPPPLPPTLRAIYDVLPVTWAMLIEDLPALYATHGPAAIVHFGVAARRRTVSIETRARNAMGEGRPDDAGRHAGKGLIEPDGPKSRPSTLPAHALVSAVEAVGVPVRASRDAGDYLCNAALWTSLAAGYPSIFVHVPQVGRTSGLGLDDLERAARAVVTAVAAHVG